jgi:hypothetical protein
MKRAFAAAPQVLVILSLFALVSVSCIGCYRALERFMSPHQMLLR